MSLRAVTGWLALAGIAVAGYLTYVHYAELQPLCVGGGGGCERVQSSPWAELGGVPVALLGLLAYATLIGALLWRARRVAATVAFTGFGFSAWLTYVEIAELDAICPWCVASAACMTVLAVLTAREAA